MLETKKWFDENVLEDVDDLLAIANLANTIVDERISLGIGYPETTLAIYATIFDTIVDKIADFESTRDSFELNIANRLIIGYNTTDNSDDEKVGNFMVYLNHPYEEYTTTIKQNKDDEDLDDNEKTVTLCVEWNAANVKEQATLITEIATAAKKAITEKLNIKTESAEFVIPLFCIIHEQIINYLRIKRVEEGVAEKEINCCGIYTVGIRETDDGDEEIYYIPSISLKLKFKDDKASTGKSEDAE